MVQQINCLVKGARKKKKIIRKRNMAEITTFYFVKLSFSAPKINHFNLLSLHASVYFSIFRYFSWLPRIGSPAILFIATIYKFVVKPIKENDTFYYGVVCVCVCAVASVARTMRNKEKSKKKKKKTAHETSK